MEKIEIKTRGLVLDRNTSLGMTLPVEVVRALELRPGQQLVLTVGECGDTRGLFVVPVKEEGGQ